MRRNIKLPSEVTGWLLRHSGAKAACAAAVCPDYRGRVGLAQHVGKGGRSPWPNYEDDEDGACE